MHVGVLYDKDPALALIMLDLLRREGDLVVGDNAPYAITDNSDYSVPDPRRTAQAQSRRDRDPPGPDRRRGRPGRLGGSFRSATAVGQRGPGRRLTDGCIDGCPKG